MLLRPENSTRETYRDIVTMNANTPLRLSVTTSPPLPTSYRALNSMHKTSARSLASYHRTPYLEATHLTSIRP